MAEEEEISIELDLSDALAAAAKALYEGGEEFDPAVPFDQLSEEDQDGYEAAAVIVVEEVLPSITEQLLAALEDGEE